MISKVRIIWFFRQKTRRSSKKRNKSRHNSNSSVPTTGVSASFCKNCGTVVGVSLPMSAAAGKQPMNFTNISKILSGGEGLKKTFSDEKSLFGANGSCPGDSSRTAAPEPCPNCGSFSRLVSCEDLPCPAGMMSSSHSSSDLSSPNESCYSFVRRALQVDTSSCCSSAESSSSADKQVPHQDGFTFSCVSLESYSIYSFAVVWYSCIGVVLLALSYLLRCYRFLNYFLTCFFG